MRKAKKIGALLLSASIILGSLNLQSNVAYAAAATPTLNGYQLGDHAKLEWGVAMQSADVLNQTGFESGDEIPNMSWSGTGNQSVTAAPGGGNALRVTDTMTNHTGNLINYPATNSDWSISQFSGKSIPAGSTTSITFRAYSSSGTFSQMYFNVSTGWYKRGYALTDNNGRQVLFGQSVDWNNAPTSFSAYVNGGTISFNDGQLVILVSSHDQNYNYGVIFYEWSASQQKFLRSSNNTAPWGVTMPKGQTPTVYKDVFTAGESVLRYDQGGAQFPARQIANNGQWATYSANVQIPSSTEYDYMTYGVTPQLFWQTNGNIYVDDIQFGYATQANLYRNSSLIYNGYLSDYEDTAAVDTTAPNPASGLNVSVVNRYPQISWAASAGDNGTTYNYQIQGVAPSGSSAISGNYPVTVTSGLKGYSVVVDTNPNTTPSNTITTTGTSISWPSQVSSNFYVHVAAVDNQGNLSSVAHYLYTDTVQPSLSISASTATWTSGNVTLTATASDNETGLNNIKKPDNSTSSSPATYTVSSNGSYTFVATDNAGNTKSSTYSVTNIDKTAPTAPTITLTPSTWTSSNVTVTVANGTDTQSGVLKSQYKIGAGGAWQDYAGSFTISTDGQTNVYAQTIDNVGNISTVTSATAKVDKTAPSAPVLTLSQTTWTNQDVQFTITNGTDSGSGVLKSQYKIGAGVWTDYTVPVTISTEGQTDIYARTLDNVNNASSTVMQTARIDKTPPSDPQITLSNNTWSQTPVSFTIGGSTDVNTISYDYKINNGAFGSGTNGTVTQNGITTITARAKDNVGNIGNEVTKQVFIDNVVPTIKITPNQVDWQPNDVNVSVQYADTDSGVDSNKRYYKVTNSTVSPGIWDAATSNTQAVTITSEGVWYVHAKATDIAGNSYETVSAAINVQRLPTAPANVKVDQVTETSASISWDLPGGGVYTDGWQYQVQNAATGQTWTVTYPNHSIVDTALQGGKSYQYIVKASNHVGQSPDSAPALALTLPKAPQNIVIQKVGTQYGQVTASFDPVESATGYHIIAKDPGNNEAFNQTVTGTVYQPITGLAAGTNYTIIISAINGSGEGASANAAILTLPSAPGHFNTVQVGVNDIRIGWDTVTSSTYYNLQRDGLPVYGGPANVFDDIFLQSGTTYNYTLNAKNATGYGDNSYLNNIITLPGQPQNLRISNPTTTSLTASWDEVRGASQYVIKVNGQTYATAPYGVTTVAISGLTAGTNYTVSVYAVNASGQGATAIASSITIPDMVNGLTAANIQETGTTLQWQPVTGADKYRVNINGQTYEVSNTQLPITGLSGSKTYTFTVEAGNDSGYGAVNNASLLTLPYQPGNITVTSTTETTIGLKWDPVDTAMGYIVTQEGAGVVGNPTTNEFNVSGLTPGSTYKFYVQTVNATGQGQQTMYQWISKPSAPANVKTLPNAYIVNASWDAVPGAAQYVIENNGTELYRGSQNAALISGLTDGSDYSYTVNAINANGIVSEKTPFAFTTLPKKPVEVTANNIKNDQLTLDFSKSQVIGATHWIIERDGEEVATIRNSYKSYTDPGLTAGTKYSYTVKASNATGVGAGYSLDVTTKTVPVDTGSIHVTAETNSVTATWDNVQGQAGFTIRNTVTGDVYDNQGTSATLPNLEPGTSYTFEIKIINASGVSSDPVTFNIITKPAAPGSVTVQSVTEKSAVLDFSHAGVKGADQFIIQRNGQEIGRIPVSQTTYTDNGLDPGTEYTYFVKAINSSGESDNGFTVRALTLPATATTPAAPSAPTVSSVTISWDAVPGATGYKVYVGDTLIATTTETSFTLDNLESAKLYDNIKIVPFNASGDGAAIAVPKIDTLPSDQFTVTAKPGTTSIEYTMALTSPNEIFVIGYKGQEVYRGKDRHFTLENVESGTVHSVAVHTENSSGAATTDVTVNTLTKPDAPDQVGYFSTQNSIFLDFTNTHVRGADQYVIVRNDVEIGRTSVTSATYEDAGRTPGTEYNYVVKAANGSGVSDAGYTLKTTTLPGAILTTPTSNHPSTSGYGLSWDAVPGAKGYKVYIGDTLATTTTETSLQLQGLESAKKYDNVRIVPFNDAGDGESIAVPEFVTLPSDNYTVEITNRGTSFLEYNWKLDSQNEIFVISYGSKEVYRGKDRTFKLTSLPSGSEIQATFWTENEVGIKSKEKLISGRTYDETRSGSGGISALPAVPVTPPEEVKSPVITPTTDKQPIQFVDIGTTFNKDEIQTLAEQGVIKGVTPTTFEPDRAITRAEYTALIVRLMGLTMNQPGNSPFVDVKAEDWFAQDISVAVQNGIIDGMGEGVFAPNELITREQAAKILAVAVKRIESNVQNTDQTFADQNAISGWANQDVQYLLSAGMLQGYQDNTFRPQQNLNRAEAAALIYRLKESLK